MADAKTSEGGCHCGDVRFKVTTDLAQVMRCNCSICTKKGHLLTFVSPDKFELVSGEGKTTDYQFNKKVIHHLFCSRCGIASFGRGIGPDGKEMYGINVRCLDGVDLSTLSIIDFDGKSL